MAGRGDFYHGADSGGLFFEFFQAVKWSDHSYQVLAESRVCEQLIIDMETGTRGYLLTGDPVFLQPYNEALPRIDTGLAKLKGLIGDNPNQELQLEDLVTARNTWLQEAQASISQRQQGKIASDDWNRMSKTLMDDIRAKFDRFNGTEEQLRDQRLRHVRSMRQNIGYLGGGLVVLLALTVGQMVRRQFMTLAGGYREALSTIEQRHAALARSEADLEEQKEWFRVTLTSIGDGVIVTDQEGRVVFMNQEAERLTGMTSVESLLKPLPAVFRIVHEVTRVRAEDPVARVFREKKVVGLANSTVLLSHAGHEWPIEDSAAPIYDRKGRILGVVLVFHNAIEMRHAQNTLKAHSEDLERKVSARTTALQQTVSELEAFSYTVSHDLRSPLRAMQGFAQAVLEDYGDKIDEQGKDYLHRIRNAAERLDRLIQDMLSYTRLSREAAPLVALDLDTLIREIIEHYPNLHEPAAQVRVEGTLPKILGREAALTQVISNILGNAVKFVAPGNGSLHPGLAEDQGERVRLWFEDNGIGIPQKDTEQVFQMFFQVNESQLYGGTGVGLAIVKKAVETMRGSVGVESQEGLGSKFWVELLKA